MPKIPADAEDFEPGSDERNDAAYATAGTTAPTDSFIQDWGEYDEAHTSNQHAQSWEHTEVDENYFNYAEIWEETE